MEKQAKIYDIHLGYEDDNEGYFANSFVDAPAVEERRYTFRNEEEQEIEKLVFSDDTREQCFISVSIKADTPISRIDKKTGDLYYVRFPKKSVRVINNKFFMKSDIHNVNYNHDSNIKLKDVYLVESFILEKGRVESPLFSNVPDGSLIQTYFVKDKKMYEKLLNDDKFNGFSIEIECGIIEQFKSSTPEEKIKEIAFSIELSEDEKIEQIKKILDL